MENFSEAILIQVCDYLPWREKFSSRQLSKKFGDLSRNPIELLEFKMKQENGKFTFFIRFHDQKQNKIIEVVEDKQSRRRNYKENSQSIKWKTYKYSKSIANQEEWNERFKKMDEYSVRKTIIQCNWYYFHNLIVFFMSLFVSEFVTERFEIDGLEMSKVMKLTKICTENPVWMGRKYHLTLETNSVRLNEEEEHFLDLFRDPYSFTLGTPANFVVEENFNDLLAIATAKQLTLYFGKDHHRRMTNYGRLQIDEAYVDRLLAEKREKFISNAISTVSVPYILDYIEVALNGGFAMFRLRLQRNFTKQNRNTIRHFLSNRGFQLEGDESTYKAIYKIGEMEQEHPPDYFIVELSHNAIVLMADYRNYRGKDSWAHPYFPYTNDHYHWRDAFIPALGVVLVSLLIEYACNLFFPLK